MRKDLKQILYKDLKHLTFNRVILQKKANIPKSNALAK